MLRGGWLAKALGDRGRLLGLSMTDGLIRLGDAASVAVVASGFFEACGENKRSVEIWRFADRGAASASF